MNKKFPAKVRAAVYAMFGGRCAYCGDSIPNKKVMHMEHRVAVSRGGPDEITNLFPSCSPCNVSKGCRDTEYLRVSLAIRRSPLKGIITSAVAVKLLEVGAVLPFHIGQFLFEREGV